MDRWDLSLKLPSTLEKARKIAASTPNIIVFYEANFYDLLEQTIEELGIQQRPECIWNTDDSSLFTDAQRTKCISHKGDKASRVTATSGREAVTVMAAISAAGEKRPPFAVFKGELRK